MTTDLDLPAGVTPTPLALLLLGRGADPDSERGVDCPGELPAASDPTLVERARAARADARRAGVRARPPLPARGGHPVRRRDRRLVQARAAGRRPAGAPSTSCSAACTSWPRAPTSSPRTRSRSCCPTSPPAARWPTWRRSTRSRTPGRCSTDAGVADSTVPVTYMNSSAAIKALHRPARRHGLHLVERAARAGLGLRRPRRARRCCSCPTSTSAATPRCWSWACRWPTAWSSTRTSRAAGVTAERAAGGPDDPLARALLGARPVPLEAVGDVRARIPGVQVIVHPECRHEVVTAADLVGSTEYIIRAVDAAPAGAAFAVGHRAQPGAAAGEAAPGQDRGRSWRRRSATAPR